MTEFTTTELEEQHVELLPAKETLYFNHNWANVYAANQAMALNAGTYWSHANAAAWQNVSVSQH